ncbi:phospholipid carrier-dependent glycosyltransferase [Lacinutrix sp.]|uniref:phospholipid carrier-dependent glycosyltransferase n=2 Tax=Lacinutrix sp. TaxID=1937692 RepID=UPI0035C87D7D
MIKSITHKKYIIKVIYILILTLGFIKIYSSIFDQKISLIGDNASYYILGHSIANGYGYTNIQHLEREAHYHYPPGYPLLIAGITTLFSNEIIPIKIFNGILLFGAILLLFFIIKLISKNIHIAFAVCFISMLNYHLLEYSTIMMSEIPFQFFSFLSLWLFLKINFSLSISKNWKFWVLLICLSFSFYIRSIALALLVSFTFFLLIKKHWKYLFNLNAGFLLLYLPWMLRNRSVSGNTYISQLLLKNPYQPELGSIGITDLVDRVLLNFERHITKEIPSGLLQVKDIMYEESSTIKTEWLIGLLILTIIVFGIYKLPNFRILILSYVVAFLSILMLWPSVWYGTRFLVPIIPLLIFLFVFGIIQFLIWLNSKLFSKSSQDFVTITVTLIIGFWSFVYGDESITKLKEQAQGVYTNNYQNYFALADWVKKNTEDNAVTSVRKEGLFYLFSKKPVTNYKKTLNREEQIEYLKSKNVNYVVIEQLGFSSTNNYLLPTINRYPNKFKIIKELKNPNTYLMQFLPSLGYSGDWKNEKRNGLGTYVWEDGQKYTGHWKNDVRHGKGAVYFKNREIISGVWINGKLEGEVIKKTKDGKILEKSIYKNNEKVKVIDEDN